MSGPATVGGRGDGPTSPPGGAGGAGATDPRTAYSDVVLPPDADEAVRELARSGIARFQQEGIDLEVVRARANCLVVRSTVRSPADASRGRARVSEWLGSLPMLAHHTPGTVLEATAGPSDGRRCIHTLLWTAGPPLPTSPMPMSRPEPPPPAALEAAADVVPPVAELPAPPAAGQGAPPPLVPTGWLPVAQVAPSASVDARPLVPEVAAGGGDDRSGGGVRGPVPAAAVASPRRRRRWAWLRRRGWMLALGLVAGAVGGTMASGQGVPTYKATSMLVVQSGASTQGPGSANDAEALAGTYAALIPEDKQLVDEAARALGTTPADVSSSLQVQSDAGTSLLQLGYSSPDPNRAVAGADELARLLTSTSPPGHAIPAGSVAVVSPPAGATRSGSLHKYGLPLGILLGLLVGVVAAMVAERIDRRVDDIEGLGDGVGCPVTAVPGGISAPELAAALQREVDPPVTVVPLRHEQSALAGELAQALSAAWPARVGRPAAGVGPVFTESPESMGAGDGATVVVVGTGERLGAVHEMAERLRLVGRDPAWAVLDVGVQPRALRGRGD